VFTPATSSGAAAAGTKFSSSPYAALTFVDLRGRRTIRHEAQATRVGWTPFDGFEATGWPMATVIRGRVVMRDGEVVAPHGGEPLRFLETL
jgi:dihydroorotase